MSTVVTPIWDAGEVEFEDTFVRLYPSLSSMIVIGSAEQRVPSGSTIGLNGERVDGSLSEHVVRGQLTPPMLGSVDTGIIPDNVALASLDEGLAVFDPSFNAFELEGEGVADALSILETQAENSLTGSIEYRASASIISKFESLAPALSSAGIAGEELDASRSVLAVRGERSVESMATLETASEGSGYPALSSLETGVPTEATQASRASADVQAGESVEFMVDIQDEILSGGHGDC